MNELNPTNAFGELILDLIEAQYGEGNIDAGIQALMESTGLEEDEVISIIEGTTIVDDENLLAAIVDAFPEADENDLEVIINVASSVDEEDRNALISQIESDELEAGQDPALEDESLEEPAAAGYMYNSNNNANFNSYLNNLDNRLAQFEQAQVANFYANELQQLDNLASNYVANEALPPSYKSMLIGNFSSPEERLARFTRIAAENGVDVPTMLFATKYAMGMLTDAAQFVEFKDYSVSDEQVAVANFSANLDAVVSEDLKAIFGE